MARIDYGLIRDLGGAEARGRGQALDIQSKEAALTDYLAQTQGKRAVGGGDLAGFYEQDIKTKNYQNEMKATFPLLLQGIKVGDEAGITSLNESLKTKYGDLHNVNLTSLIPGQSASMETIKLGSKMIQDNPDLEGQVDPSANYVESSTITADGQFQLTGIKPAAAGKQIPAAETIVVGDKTMQWNPATSRYDIEVGRAPIKGGKGGVKTPGSTASLKWDKDAGTRLDKQYGELTADGYLQVPPAKMAEYQDANTYLVDYKDKGLDPNTAAVLAERRAKAGGADPIQTVIDQQRALRKSDKEIKSLLRKSQFKSVNPRAYGLK